MGDSSADGSSGKSSINCPNPSVQKFVNANQLAIGICNSSNNASFKIGSLLSIVQQRQQPQLLPPNQQQAGALCASLGPSNQNNGMQIVKGSMFGQCRQDRDLLTEPCKGDQQRLCQNSQAKPCKGDQQKFSQNSQVKSCKGDQQRYSQNSQSGLMEQQNESPKLPMGLNKEEKNNLKFSADEKIEIIDLAKSIGNRAAGRFPHGRIYNSGLAKK